jgi:hypothetical protein
MIHASFGKVAAGAALIGTGIGIMMPFKQALDASAYFESVSARMEGALGSMAAAKQFIADMKAEEPTVPFDIKSIVDANAGLIGIGVSASHARESVDAMINTLAGVGAQSSEDLKNAAFDMQKIQEMGYADSRHLNSLMLSGHIPILQLLSDKYGVATESARKMHWTFDQIIEAMKSAYPNATGRMMDTINGKISSLHSQLFLTFANIGDALKPAFHVVIDFVLSLMNKLREFTETTQGKVVVGVLAVAAAFVSLGTILTGLTIVVKALRPAIVESMKPLFAIAPTLIVVGAAFYGLYYIITRSVEAFSSFHKAATNATGFAGWMQRVGGFIQVIREVWNTWNGLTYALSYETVDRLKALGIYETALAVATWVLRVKEFFGGVATGVQEAAGVVWSVVSTVFNAISEVVSSFFDIFGINIAKNTSDLSTWSSTGEVVGWVIVGVLGAITIALGSFAVAQAAAFLPWIAIAAGVAAAAYLTYKAIGYVISGFQWLWAAIKPVRDGFNLFYTETIARLTAGFTMLWDVLSGIGNFIANVFTTAWDYLAQKVRAFTDAVNSIVDFVSPTFEWLGTAIQDYLIPVFNMLGGTFGAVMHGIASTFEWVYDKIMHFIELMKQAWQTAKDVANWASRNLTVQGRLQGAMEDAIQEKQTHATDLGKSVSVFQQVQTMGNARSTFADGKENLSAGLSAVNERSKQENTSTPIIMQLFLDGQKVAETVNHHNRLNDSRE